MGLLGRKINHISLFLLQEACILAQ